MTGSTAFQANAFQNNAFQIATAAAGSAAWDTTDPLFYDWWRKRAAEQKAKGRRKQQVEEIIETALPAVELPLRKPAVLSAQTLLGMQEAQSLQDIENLTLSLRGAEAAMMRELMAAYERERDEEEAIELLLLS